MADGDNKHWWQHWWSQTENAVLPWCLATTAVLAAIAYGSAAALRWLVPNYHRIPTSSTGPNWAEIVYTALTGVLVLIAFLALGSVREARRARIGLQMTELSRRWDEETRLKVRGKIHEYARSGLPRRLVRRPASSGGIRWWTIRGPVASATEGPQRLLECMSKLREEYHPDYRVLMTEPNFLEDLAILVDHRGIDFKVVNKSLGPRIADRWCLWEPTAQWLRHEVTRDTQIFAEFEKLALRIAKLNRRAVDMDAAGEKIIWTGFKE